MLADSRNMNLRETCVGDVLKMLIMGSKENSGKFCRETCIYRDERRILASTDKGSAYN